jgi:hypothetical protein
MVQKKRWKLLWNSFAGAADPVIQIKNRNGFLVRIFGIFQRPGALGFLVVIWNSVLVRLLRTNAGIACGGFCQNAGCFFWQKVLKYIDKNY